MLRYFYKDLTYIDNLSEEGKYQLYMELVFVKKQLKEWKDE